MAGKEFDLAIYSNAIIREADLLRMTIKDKGAGRFSKAFIISVIFVAAAYFGLYLPPQKKIARLQKTIDTAKSVAASAVEYKDLRNQLSSSYGNLPHVKDRQQWLSNAMIDSLRADGLTSEEFQPVAETEASGLVFQTSTVRLTLKFAELYAWLLRLESATPLMHAQSLNLAKKPDSLGLNTVTATVMTAIPKKRFE